VGQPATIPPFLAAARNLVYGVAPGRGQHELVYGSGLRATLDAARAAGIERIIVLGSAGVFGQEDGSLVTELTPPGPRDPAGNALLEGERQTIAAGGLVLRLGGLYARGRGPQSGLAPELAGRADRWLNLVHEQDVAAAAVHLLLDRWTPGVLHVSATPTTRGAFYGALAARRGLPAPRFRADDASLGRRLANDRARALGVTFAFPTFETGLAAGELD
jgi:nucleoside-diphosphate-sugar epimerase